MDEAEWMALERDYEKRWEEAEHPHQKTDDILRIINLHQQYFNLRLPSLSSWDVVSLGSHLRNYC